MDHDTSRIAHCNIAISTKATLIVEVIMVNLNYDGGFKSRRAEGESLF